jgi:hypothetical protein
LQHLIWKLGPVGHGFNPGAVRGRVGDSAGLSGGKGAGVPGMGGGSAGLGFGRGQVRSVRQAISAWLGGGLPGGGLAGGGVMVMVQPG